MIGASYAIGAAAKGSRIRKRRMAELRESLVVRLSEVLPAEPCEVAPPLVRVRALKTVFVRNRLVEAGDVVEVRADQVGGPLVLVGSEADVPAVEPEYDKHNPPPWTTKGHLQKHGGTQTAIGGTSPVGVRGLSPRDIERIDRIWAPAESTPQQETNQ